MALQSKRQITYQIGWKKGKIEYNSKERKSSEDVSPLETVEEKWRDVPYPTAQAAVVWLWTLPVITAGLIGWLVYSLLQFDY